MCASACPHACLGRLRCCSVGMCAPSAKVLPTTATRAAHTAPPRTTSIVAGAACTAIAPSSSKVPPYLPLPALPNCRRCRQYKPCSLAEQPLHLTSTASLRWYSRGEALAFFFWDSLHPTSPHPTPHCLTTPSPTPIPNPNPNHTHPKPQPLITNYHTPLTHPSHPSPSLLYMLCKTASKYVTCWCVSIITLEARGPE